MKEISIVIIFITSKAEHLHSIKFEIRFCACSNTACGVSEILDGENLWQWSRLEIGLNVFCRWTIPQKQFINFINSSSAKVFRSSRLDVSFKILALVQNFYFMKKWLHHRFFLGKLPIVFRTAICSLEMKLSWNDFLHSFSEVYSSFNLTKH